jgi:hypothetical protein
MQDWVQWENEDIRRRYGADNLLKSPDSDEGIQGNPRKSRAQIHAKGRRIRWNRKESKSRRLRRRWEMRAAAKAVLTVGRKKGRGDKAAVGALRRRPRERARLYAVRTIRAPETRERRGMTPGRGNEAAFPRAKLLRTILVVPDALRRPGFAPRIVEPEGSSLLPKPPLDRLH